MSEGIRSDYIRKSSQLLSDLAKDKEKPAENISASFKSLLKEANKANLEAEQSLDDLSKGKTESIHETMIAISKADISFKLILQIRNKLIEGYKEILRSLG